MSRILQLIPEDGRETTPLEIWRQLPWYVRWFSSFVWLYEVLDALERGGIIRYRLVAGGPERGYRAQRLYRRVTTRG